MESIIQKNKECFICHTTQNLQMHHIFYGAFRRQVSEENGLKVWLCLNHHTGYDGVHTKRGIETDKSLKRYAQIEWQKQNKADTNDFIRLMGRSYI